MRPTTKDLAAEAGVSLATVDRVLNARSGVRKKTIKAVKEAIKKLGFERNHVAATLARKRGFRCGIVLSEIISHIQEVNEASRGEMLQVYACKVDEKDPHQTPRAGGQQRR